MSDLQSLCFNLSYLSNTPWIQESLIFRTYISIKDIIIKRLHHDQWLKILRFWYRINEGYYVKHLINKKLISKYDQLAICAMINNMTNTGMNKNKKYDEKIPKYMQKLLI